MPTIYWIGKDKVINHHIDVTKYGYIMTTWTTRELWSG